MRAQQRRAVARDSSGSAATRPKKLRKNAISKVCSDADASRITTAISRSTGAAEHQQRRAPVRARVTAWARHQRRADDARLGFDAPRRSVRCTDAAMRRARASSCAPRRAAVVHQHQRMRAPRRRRRRRGCPSSRTASISQAAESLRVPSSAPRNTGRRGCSALQRFGLRERHDRILEEAAGVADHAPGPAACGGGCGITASATVRGARRVDAHRREFLAHAGVVQPQRAACAAGGTRPR